jgi:hypothetical protein
MGSVSEERKDRDRMLKDLEERDASVPHMSKEEFEEYIHNQNQNNKNSQRKKKSNKIKTKRCKCK